MITEDEANEFLQEWARTHGEPPDGQGWSITLNSAGQPSGAVLVNLPGFPVKPGEDSREVQALKTIQRIVSTLGGEERYSPTLARIWDAVDYGLYGQIYDSKP